MRQEQQVLGPEFDIGGNSFRCVQLVGTITGSYCLGFLPSLCQLLFASVMPSYSVHQVVDIVYLLVWHLRRIH